MAGRGRRYAVGAAGGVVLIGAAIGGLHAFQVVTVAPQTPSVTGTLPMRCSVVGSATTCTETPGRTETEKPVSGFTDGVYDAQGRYLTPGGAEAIGVRLTITDGRVVTARVEVEASSPTARQFQHQFASRYAASVVSRDLADLGLSRVAGASLTSLGFDDALTQIRQAARAQR